MKLFLYILVTASSALTLGAQTNAPAAMPQETPPATNSAPADGPAPTSPRQRVPTEIFADSGNFDLKTREAVYVGNVRVQDATLALTCGIMTTRIPESGKVDKIVADQNVIIDATDNEGRPVHATADRAVYRYRVADGITNETVELTGNPAIIDRKPDGVQVAGEVITWDLISNSFRLSKLMMKVPLDSVDRPFRQSTNAPPEPARPQTNSP